MLNLPMMKDYRHVLLNWAQGRSPHGLNKVLEGLSPNQAIPEEVRKLILAQLIGGDDQSASRRSTLVRLGTGPSASQLDDAEPLDGIASDHWKDLRAGAAFMDLRNAALAVLYCLEKRLLELRDANELVVLSVEEARKVVEESLAALHDCARRQGDRVNSGDEVSSRVFLSEVKNLPVENLLQKLAERDGTVIRWLDGKISLGPAAGEISTGEETETLKNTEFAPQLFRLYNLHCVATELKGGINPGCRDSTDEERV
jgi:hypothetical protein